MNYCRLFKRTRRRRLRNEEVLRNEVEHANTAVTQTENDGNEELKSALRQTVKELPGEYRVPLTLYYYEKMTAGEIGQLLGLKERTIYSRLEKALGFLRKKMTARGLSATEAALPTMLGAIGAGEVLRRAPKHLARSVAEFKKLPASQSVKAVGLGAQVVWLSAVVIGTGLFGGAAMYWPGNNSEMTSAVRNGIGSPEQIVAKNARLIQESVKVQDYFIKWDFNDGLMPPGFKVLKGNCRVLKRGGVNDSGCLEMKDGSVLSIPVSVPHLPLVLENSAKLILPKPEDAWRECISWANTTDELQAIEHFEEPLFLGPQKWKISRMLCAENFTVGLKSDGGFFNILVGRRKTSETPLLLAVQGNRVFDDFVIRPARPDELPDVDKYLKAVEKIEPVRRMGTVVLSEFPPIAGKPWTVRFIPNAPE